MARFEYSCPECENDLYGSFGDDVYCENCKNTYETDWDYTDAYEGNMGAWITGKIEHDTL